MCRLGHIFVRYRYENNFPVFSYRELKHVSPLNLLLDRMQMDAQKGRIKANRGSPIAICPPAETKQVGTTALCLRAKCLIN